MEDIEIGTLILKEKPQCSSKISMFDVISGLHSHDDHLFSLMDSFFSMKKNVQEEYLMLYNKSLHPNFDPEQSDYFLWKRFAQLHEEKWISNAQFHVDWQFILKIIGIHKTNGFDNDMSIDAGVGIFIKCSRFNHSCSPNSENVDSEICPEEMQIRATFKIKKGEEICMNYFPLILAMKNKKERQDHLQKEWGFICSCERCQDEDINNADETYEKFQKLQEEAQKHSKKDYSNCSSDYIEKAISCRKQMYNLAENKKAPKCFIIEMILIEWFNLEVKRYKFAKDLVHNMAHVSKHVREIKEFVNKMEYFKGECGKLAKVTLQMVKTVKGDDSNWAREWKEKCEEIQKSVFPMEFVNLLNNF